MAQSGIKGCKKCCNIALHPMAQCEIDERPPFLPLLLVGDEPRECAIAPRRMVGPLLVGLTEVLVISSEVRRDGIVGAIGAVGARMVRVSRGGPVVPIWFRKLEGLRWSVVLGWPADRPGRAHGIDPLPLVPLIPL
jgi:hypothetical protein